MVAVKTNKVNVDVRIRPLSKMEVSRNENELEMKSEKIGNNAMEISLKTPMTEGDQVDYVEVLGGFKVPKSKPKRDKKFKGFRGVADKNSSNADVFEKSVVPLVEECLKGKTGCMFAYGATGSGKSHSILGYEQQAGMYNLGTKLLFDGLQDIQNLNNGDGPASEALRLQVKFGELYNGDMYDLLNDCQKCYVRQDAAGKVRVRGETISNEKGVVIPSYATICTANNHEELLSIVNKGIEARTTGNSNVHDQSSRSHAVLEIEIVNDQIVDARREMEEKQVELAKDGYEMHTLEIDIFHRQHYKVEGKWVIRENAQGATAEETEILVDFRKDIRAKEMLVENAKLDLEKAQNESLPCVGGALVFVDLAGSEHAGSAKDGIVKTDAEQRECREINKSLSALQGCFRNISEGRRSSSCYRQSKLTMLLRDHLESKDATTSMIATISPSESDMTKTIHTMYYAQLVATS